MLKLTDATFKDLPGVYILKNLINGKEYIGKSNHIKRRMADHCNIHTQLIHKAISKYGPTNFQVYCEYYPNLTKTELQDIEEDMIKRYQTLIPNGYNICPRGISKVGCRHTPESKLKIGLASEGRIKTAESRQKLSDATLGVPKTQSHRQNISKGKKGMTFTEEHRNSLSVAHTGKILSEEHKLKISLGSKGKIYSNETIEKLRTNQPNKRVVIQLTMAGDYVAEYSSIREAERVTGVRNAKITAVCRNKRKSSGNFRWKYK